jgi:hypothetical protein
MKSGLDALLIDYGEKDSKNKLIFKKVMLK